MGESRNGWVITQPKTIALITYGTAFLPLLQITSSLIYRGSLGGATSCPVRGLVQRCVVYITAVSSTAYFYLIRSSSVILCT
jgi:hypothetical protein